MSCHHFVKIKQEQIGNLFRKKIDFSKCQFKHTKEETGSPELWFCLVCGVVACGRYSENRCGVAHFDSQHHNIMINPSNMQIWCYECDNDFDSMMENPNISDSKKEKLEKFKAGASQKLLKAYKEYQKTQKQIHQLEEAKGEEPPKNNTGGNKIINPKSIFGLRNLGNTCFFNSVMQCLNASVPLVQTYLNFQKFDVADIDLTPDDDDDKGVQEDNGWNTIGNAKGNTKAKVKKKALESGRNYKTINFAKHFQQFLWEVRNQKQNQYDPSGLFNQVTTLFSRFRGFSQQDAQELLRNFLDALTMCEEKRFSKDEIAESKQNGKKKLTETENIFGGYLCNIVKCQDCKHTNRTYDFCMDIVLNIDKAQKKPKIVQPKKKKNNNQQQQQQQDKEETKNEEQKEEFKEGGANETQNSTPEKLKKEKRYNIVSEKDLKHTNVPHLDENLEDVYEPNIAVLSKGIEVSQQADVMTIEEALKEFTSIEHLTKHYNFYKCENCTKQNKTNSGSMRRFYIYDPPQILTLVLKRYRQVSIGRYEKVNTQVKFGETLILDPFVSLRVRKSDTAEFEEETEPRYVYDLYGVVVQSGQLNSGHYVSYTKHRIQNQDVWYHHSDTHFKQISKEQALKSQAYILFYQRRDTQQKQEEEHQAK